jgi:hypothetical protein
MWQVNQTPTDESQRNQNAVNVATLLVSANRDGFSAVHHSPDRGVLILGKGNQRIGVNLSSCTYTEYTI